MASATSTSCIPEVDLAVDLSTHINLNAGYEADVVSGATPAIYEAPHAGVDAVSSATQFSDVRHEGRAGLTFAGTRSSLRTGVSYGTERDYRSFALTGGGSVDLAGHNTVLDLEYTHDFDRVCDFANGDATPLERRPLTGADPCFTSGGNTITRDIAVDTAQATLTQNLTPGLVGQLGVYGQIVDGFQSNPYRRVQVFNVEAQENVPTLRDRGAVFARANLALAEHTTLSLFVRGYADNWAVRGASAELELHQYLGPHVLIRLRARGYQQTGAVFFRDAADYATLGPAGNYFTGDRELAPLRDGLGAAKISWLATSTDGKPVLGLFQDADLHLEIEGLWTDVMTPNPPGGTVAGPAPTSIVARLGLQLRY